MDKTEKYDGKFANQMKASTAASKGLEVLAGVLPEGSYFMHNGAAYPLHGITAEKEHLPISGKTITVAEFLNSQVPILNALTGNTYVDFPVEEASRSGVNGRAIAMGLAAIAAGGAALALAPGHAYAADSASAVTLGEVMADLQALPNNSTVYGDQGKAYNLDFRVDPDGKTTSAHQIIDANNPDQMRVLSAVFGGDFARRIDGDMSNTELSYMGLTFKRYGGNDVIITIKAQYGTDARAPINEKSCNDSNVCVNVSQNNDYSLTDVRGTQIMGTLDNDGEFVVVDSLKINNSERSALEKQAAADFVNLVYDLFGGFRTVETKYESEKLAETKDFSAKSAPTDETAASTIESKLKITISDKGGHHLVDTDKDGKLDTRLGNPYRIMLAYSGPSEGSPTTAKVSVDYMPPSRVVEQRDASGTVIATSSVPTMSIIDEQNIETAMNSALSSMTPSATSIVATDTVQTNFATQTAFPNLGVYTITAEVGGAKDSVDVYFPAFAGNNNNGKIVAALLGIGVIAAVLKDKGRYDLPAAPAEVKPTFDPNTQLGGGESSHTIQVK